MKQKFTVLLLYPDYVNDSGHETYLAHVEAKSPQQAAFFAKYEAQQANETQVEEKEDFALLATFEGHLTDLKKDDNG